MATRKRQPSASTEGTVSVRVVEPFLVYHDDAQRSGVLHNVDAETAAYWGKRGWVTVYNDAAGQPPTTNRDQRRPGRQPHPLPVGHYRWGRTLTTGPAPSAQAYLRPAAAPNGTADQQDGETMDSPETPPGHHLSLPSPRQPTWLCKICSVRVPDFCSAQLVSAPFWGFPLVRSRYERWRMGVVPCGWCGKSVRQTESGRRRRWCSDACRMTSYRAHRRAKN
jgi:hypothetical protein